MSAGKSKLSRGKGLKMRLAAAFRFSLHAPLKMSLAATTLLCLFLFACGNPSTPTHTSTVALYCDDGSWNESVTAIERMFLWMDYGVARVNAAYVNSKGLRGFSIFCVPGGDMYEYSQDLTADGKENIRTFVRDGGGYIGICGGAYFAASRVVWRGGELPMTPLALYSGTAQGPIDDIVPYPNYGMCRIDIVDTTHAITHSEPDSTWILYYWGPMLLPEAHAAIDTLGLYNIGQRPCMLAFTYGKGRVFLVGAHLEIEEDSERDSVAFGDELDDRGSDWKLMARAARWCLKH